ncbi:MAG: prephenate dehydrogenase/arogenate dehydrogenase family protein [Veillonella sp.]|uniref:prephenate dehydrogenase n=1 Tax=Veillonella sp. TaxID=1926307 RepID=UPI0025F8E0E6|nr:prephenate dehydrogenase/arogenate dehydrogenase family protein [Veillonella sp.]MBE6079567.1 prephenate dehydrogenase/arogenate dehydrogenase family protein [Veillonella sp.]
MKRKVGIIGLGLLGGSLAKGLAKFTDYEVIGYARRPEICEAAMADKVVARAYTDPKQVVAEADILVFALPPDTNARLFEELAPLIRPRTLITDVSSTKTNFARTVKQNLPAGASFVSVHPMAGSEKGGYAMAKADLFKHCTWIVLEDDVASGWCEAGAAELTRMGELLGSRIERIPMSMHDGFMATVSHMPHTVASMIATIAGGDEYGDLRLRLAAGGFRDVTRVAGGNPAMWREIITGNRTEVVRALSDLEQQISIIKNLLLTEDDDTLESYLNDAKHIRDKFSLL